MTNMVDLEPVDLLLDIRLPGELVAQRDGEDSYK